VDGWLTSPAWEALQRASSEDRARWQALWVEEYRSLRSESEQARNAQQTILQWSLASFAAILAGSLLMFQGASSHTFHFSGEAGTVVLLIFGLGLPGLGFCSYLVWWGEFLRMERAGRYIRGLELAAERLASNGETSFPPPLQWEHFLAGHARFPKGKPTGRTKQLVGYVGTTGIYFGFSVSSLIIFVSIVVSHSYHLGPWGSWVRGLSLVWSIAYICLFIAVTWLFKSSADRQSRQGVLSADVLPALEFIPFGPNSGAVPPGNTGASSAAANTQSVVPAPAASSEPQPGDSTVLPEGTA
jgi:hypothetical protein